MVFQQSRGHGGSQVRHRFHTLSSTLQLASQRTPQALQPRVAEGLCELLSTSCRCSHSRAQIPTH